MERNFPIGMRTSTLSYLIFSLTQLFFFLFFGVLNDFAVSNLITGNEYYIEKIPFYDAFQIISGHHLFLMILSFFMTTVNNHRARNSFNLALSILSFITSLLYITKSIQKRFLILGWIIGGYNMIVFLVFLILWIRKEPVFEKND